MKKSLITLLLLPLTLWAFSQDVTFTVGSSSGLNGAQVSVPVQVKNFNNILLFSQSIRIDNGQVARFTATPITDVIPGTKSINRVNDTLVTIAWGSNSPVSLDGNSVIFVLNIEMIGSPNQSVGISIQNSPTDIEVIDGNGTALGHQEENGSVSVEEVRVNIQGKIHLPDGRPISGVMVPLQIDNPMRNSLDNQITTSTGLYEFMDYEINNNYSIEPNKEEASPSFILNGIDGRDQLSLLRHISGINPLSSVRAVIAADVNRDGRISLLDGGEIFRLVGNGIEEFSNSQSWLFIPTDEFNQLDISTALQHTYATSRTYTPLDEEKINQDFVGIKVGDLTNDVEPNLVELSLSILGHTLESDDNCSQIVHVVPEYSESGCSGVISLSAEWVYIADEAYCGIDSSGLVTDVINGFGFKTPAFQPGVLTVTFIAEDECGNLVQEETIIPISGEVDNVKPTPVLLKGLATELMPSTDIVTISAASFDFGSFDNCTACSNDLIFSFSADIFDTSRSYTCGNLGTQPIEIWVTDHAGNQNFAETHILIQNNSGACSGPTDGVFVGNARENTCEKPTPIVINGLATTLMPSTSTIEVSAAMFDIGSHANCTTESNLDFRIFKGDPIQGPQDIGGVQGLASVVTFDCNELGANSVSIYIIDDEDNWDVVGTYIIIQNNNAFCEDNGGMFVGNARNGNCEKPTLFVANGLTTTPMFSTGTIEVSAAMFDFGSHANCTPESNLDFRILKGDPSQGPQDIEGVQELVSTVTFSCDNGLGFQPVSIYAIDEEDNWDVVGTFIIIQFGNGGCSGVPLVGQSDETSGKISPNIRTVTKSVNKSKNNFSTLSIPSQNRNAASSALQLTPFVINNQTTSIDLLATGFEDVSGFQYSISWDATKFKFKGINNFSPLVADLENSFFLNQTEKGVLTCVWVNDEPINLDAKSILSTLHFEVIGKIGKTESIKILSNPTKLLVFDTDLQEIEVRTTHSFLKTKTKITAIAKNINDVHQLEIGPNPSNGLFKWKLDNQLLEPLEVTIFDSFGRQIKAERLSNTSYHSGTLDLSSYAAGVYWFSVRGKSTLFSEKLVLLK